MGEESPAILASLRRAWPWTKRKKRLGWIGGLGRESSSLIFQLAGQTLNALRRS